jgi:hypothetical protein
MRLRCGTMRDLVSRRSVELVVRHAPGVRDPIADVHAW